MSKKENLLKFWESMEGKKLKPSFDIGDLPLLPRNEILSQPTKNRARRERKRHSSPKYQDSTQETSNLLNLTPPAAEYDPRSNNTMNVDASLVTGSETGSLEDIKKKLTSEFMEKLSNRPKSGTFPKPTVHPRRSSLQFSSNYNSVKDDTKSCRKSVGDVFGERLTSSNKISKPQKTFEKQNETFIGKKGSVQELSSRFKKFSEITDSFNKTPSLKYTMSPEHPSLIRSATWVEEFKAKPGTSFSHCQQENKADDVNQTILQLKREFEAKFAKLESELLIERKQREKLEKELEQVKCLFRYR